ncbi:MAG: hypothetical protein QGI75_08180 [Phycisphaerales bacterium]|jgi:hypothetical protein|nr:hypothetical protein [Phycisphaerales bacterium]
MKTILAMTIGALLVGCGTVSSVEGWAGGPVRAGVEDGTAVVRYEAPRPGWTLTVDRSKVTGDTAVLWMTATGQTGGPLERTPIVATWRPEDSAAFQCVQINLRLAGHDAYRPATVGCGPLSE